MPGRIWVLTHIHRNIRIRVRWRWLISISGEGAKSLHHRIHPLLRLPNSNIALKMKLNAEAPNFNSTLGEIMNHPCSALSCKCMTESWCPISFRIRHLPQIRFHIRFHLVHPQTQELELQISSLLHFRPLNLAHGSPFLILKADRLSGVISLGVLV